MARYVRFFVSYFPVIKKLSALFLACRIIKVSFHLSEKRQLWEYNIRAVLKISAQWSASSGQRPESSVLSSASSVQGPMSKVQSLASRVQHPESSVQGPESSVQLLHPESRNSGMPSWNALLFMKTSSRSAFGTDFCSLDLALVMLHWLAVWLLLWRNQ